MSKAYYNEIDPYAAKWLRNLIAAGEIAPGDVDERSIADVQPDDLTGYVQCHFFAGVGGWSLALRLAGWPDGRRIWTGSAPCQPYSSAGKGAGDADPRNLWPQFFRLIRECRPVVVAGEQVSSAIRHGWLDGISADLEGAGYAVGSVVLGAHSAGAPHIRQRLYWLADSADHRASEGEQAGQPETERSGSADGLADSQRADARRGDAKIEGHAGRGRDRPAIDGDVDGMADSERGGCGTIRTSGWCGSDGTRHGVNIGSETADAGAIDRLEHPSLDGWDERRAESGGGSVAGGVGEGHPAIADGAEFRGEPSAGEQSQHERNNGSGFQSRDDGMGKPVVAGLEGHAGDGADGDEPGRLGADAVRSTPAAGAWSDYRIIPCRDGKARRISAKPGIFAMVDGISGRMGSVCSSTLQEIEKEIVIYANATNSDPRQAMCDVWETHGEDAIQRAADGSGGLYQAEVLLAYLRKLQRQGWNFARCIPPEGEKALEERVRMLWGLQVSPCAPHRQRLDEQHPGEYSDALHILSSVLARNAHEAWKQTGLSSYAGHEAPLSVKGADPNRIGRLKGYGNAIVPQDAAEFIRAYMEILS